MHSYDCVCVCMLSMMVCWENDNYKPRKTLRLIGKWWLIHYKLYSTKTKKNLNEESEKRM